MVARVVQEGRERLNFSEWGTPRSGGDDEGEGLELDEIGEVISEGEMPPANYLPAHPEARLTSEEKQALIDGLIKSLGQ
jgi:hypothetical protein